jgi:hypothetical protein
MNVKKVERFNGGGGCMYALIWELDKFIVVGDNMVTIWNSEKEFFNAIDGKHSYPQEVLEYNTRRMGERT